VVRLAQLGSLQLHIPAFVKGEVLTQQQRDIRDQLNKLTGAADTILRTTGETNLTKSAEEVKKIINAVQGQADDSLATELQTWITDAKAIEHPIQADHGTRVAAAYFAGIPPFRAAKHRDDIPDAFIWETALDLVQQYGALTVISSDGRLRLVAEEHQDMQAFKSLEEFIESDDFQDAVDEATPTIFANNIARIIALLPKAQDYLIEQLGNDIVNELAGKTVRHDAIPDDNNEGLILMVGAPENVGFTFGDADHYGDGEIGIPFTATVDCELNYAIYKADYYSLDEEKMKSISIEERNDHYFDADQDYTISIAGYITIMIDSSDLESDELLDDDLYNLIIRADTSTEVTERGVLVSGW